MATTIATLETVYTANTTGFDTGTQRVQTSLTNVQNQINGIGGGLGTRLTTIGNQMQTFGTRMMILGGVIAAPLVLSIRRAMEFESAFAGVIKTVDGTEEELAALRDTIRDMATDSSNPLSGLENAHTTIAHIMELGGQLDITVQDLQEFAQVIGELSLATDLMPDDAAMQIAQFANITGLPTEDLRRFGSVIVDLGNNMATTESQIMNMASRIAAAGTLAGFDDREILAVAGALSSLGVNAEMGGTNFSMFLGAVSTAVAENGDDLALLAETAGTTEANFAWLWEDDPATALTDFLSGFGDLPQAEQLQILDDLGLSGARMTSILQRLAGNTDLLSDALTRADDAWDQNSALGTEAQTRLQTTESQFNSLKNKVNDLAISLGEALLPATNDVIDGLGPMVDRFNEFAQAHPNVVTGIAAVAAGLLALGVAAKVGGLALTGLGAITTIGSSLVSAVTAAGPAVVSALAGVITSGLGAAILGVGIGVIIANVLEDAGVGQALRDALGLDDDFQQDVEDWFFDNIFNPIVAGIEGIGDFIENPLGAIEGWFESARRTIDRWVLDIQAAFLGFADSITSGAIGDILSAAGFDIASDITAQLTSVNAQLAQMDLEDQINAQFNQVMDQVTAGGGFDTGATIQFPALQLMPAEEAQLLDPGAVQEALDAALEAGSLEGVQILLPLADIVGIDTTEGESLMEAMGLDVEFYEAGDEAGAQMGEGFGVGFGGALDPAPIVSDFQADFLDGAQQASDDFTSTMVAGIDPVQTELDATAGQVDGIVSAAAGNPFANWSIPTLNMPGDGAEMPGYASGTSWTGNMGMNTPAGIVHGQEAVVPAEGMSVLPSPQGLMLQGSIGGGGPSISGSTFIFQGVEDVEDFFDQLQQVAQRRGN